MRKGEIVCYKQFSLFHNVFYSYIPEVHQNKTLYGDGLTLSQTSPGFYVSNTSLSYVSNLVRIFVSMKSQLSLKLGNVKSKTRSPGQILGKPCIHPCSHIFSLILMKLGQNVCLNEILAKMKKNGLCQIKNYM